MERTWKPTTAGILNIITGVMGIAGGILAIVFSSFFGLLGATDWNNWIQQWGGGWLPGGADIPSLMGGIMGGLGTIVLVAGIVILVFGVIALLGGISALRRLRWGLALAGAILSLPIMPVLAILAIIFVSLGKKEFS